MLKHCEWIVTLVLLQLHGYNGEVDILTDHPDCYTGETSEYMGTRSTTKSGLDCKRWDQLEPDYFFTDDEFPDGSKCKAMNYCRDPLGYGFLWCLTTDQNITVGVCNVTRCGEPSGNITSHDCYIITDKDRDSGRSETEICESRPGGSKVCGGSKDVPNECEDCEDCCQEKDCYSGCIKNYNGTWHRTQSGRQCQNWASQWPHEHHYNKGHMFLEDESVIAAQNYCRNPDRSGNLWCYTMDLVIAREDCGIPEC